MSKFDNLISTLETPDDGPSFFASRESREDLPLARDVLIRLMLDGILSADHKTRLVDAKPLTLVLEVPSARWVHPIAEALGDFSHDSLHTLCRGTIPKDIEDPFAIRFAGEGRPVVGISPIPDRALPPAVLALAEERIVVSPPSAAMMVETMRRCQRGDIPEAAHTLNYSLLDFDELTAMISRGGTPAQSVERMSKLIATKTLVGKKADRLPKLEDAVEYGEARDWALNLRDDIRDYKAGNLSWDAVDRGAIFHGPPGTGKTLLARMLGEACGVPTVVTSVGEYFASSAGYLDSVIKAQRRAFDEARAKAPCILFLDELNALPNLDTVGSKNRDYWAPVILDFYQLLDGAMADREGIVVIGATNRLEDIHPALLRPGRFERAIHIGPPNAAGVERIMRHHLGDDLKDMDISGLARIAAVQRATGAEIMEKTRAARRLARRAGRSLQIADIERQISPPETRTDAETMRAAVHEAGHALVATTFKDLPVNSISIISHGSSGGTTEFGGMMLGNFHMRERLESTCVMMMAGRAAEALILGEASGGCGGSEDSDLARVTKIAGMMFGGLGMGSSLSYRTAYDDAVSVMRIDAHLRRQVDEAMVDFDRRATGILKERESSLRRLVDELLSRKFMTGEEARSVLMESESVPSSLDAAA